MLNIIPTIAVMLCTYNGERFLEKQLYSLAYQTIKPSRIFINDDGSTDQTISIIERCKANFPNLSIEISNGPQKGFENNFLSFFNIHSQPPADYMAYADQDDIWELDKLERAVHWLQKLPAGQAGLYGGRTCLIDSVDRTIGFSPLFSKEPSFANALVQNIMGGNTMVMNAAAWYLMKAASMQRIKSHDLWTYQILSGAGGAIFYDPHPTVRYRQHQHNLIGANNSLRARWGRFKMLMKGEFYRQNEMHVTSLLAVKYLFTTENQQRLMNFSQARTDTLWHRLFALKKSGVYRQNFLGTIALWLAVFLRKI